MFECPPTMLAEEVLKHLQPQPNVAAQQLSLDYIEQVKNSPDGWRRCIGWLTKGEKYPPDFEFFCLGVIAHYVSQRYRGAGEELRLLKEFLSYWIHTQCNLNMYPRKPSYFGNKIAQIFTATFVHHYPATWPTFFSDLVDSLKQGMGAVDLYLRVLLAINEEITQQDIPRGHSDMERNSAIKTAMRESDVVLLVESWFQILKHPQSEPDLTNKCLLVISVYVSWIHIDHIANDRFIKELLAAVERVALREQAVLCLLEIVKKGMDPVAKLRLIESLLPIMSAAHVFDVIEDDDTEFTCRVSNLVNTIGLSLIDAHRTLSKGGLTREASAVEASIESKIPLLILYLGNDYDDVSTAVVPFTREYIQMLKQKVFPSNGQHNNIHSILSTVFRKMKYDVSYNFDQEGEDEADFDQYRKVLKVVFENVAGLNRDLLTDYVLKYVLGTVAAWRESSFQQVEVALTVMHMLGEAVPTVARSFPAAGVDQPSPVQRMMRAVVESGLSAHPHPHVALQYFETAVRFEKFFEAEPDHLQALLGTFLDTRGLHHPSCKVRSRCSYLFLKLIKSLKTAMQPYAVDMLRPLQSVLVLCVQEHGVGLNTRDTAWVGRDDQLYLYEAAAIIIISSSCTPAMKSEALRDLLTPALTAFARIVPLLRLERDVRRYEDLSACLVHIIAVTSRASKAFLNYEQLKANACVGVFTDSIQVFMPSLQIPYSSGGVKCALRQFLHRMVVCLEDELLPYFVQATEGLLKDNDVASIQEYLPLLVQVITKFKLSWVFQKEVLPFLAHALVPITRHVFTALNAPMDANDEEARLQRLHLHRNYYSMVHAVSYQDLMGELRGRDPAFLAEVEESVVRAAVQFHDLIAQKCCFSILRQFLVMWGPDTTYMEFMYTSIVPACFTAPFHREFDLEDAQAVPVLAEIAMCMRLVYDVRGPELIRYLKMDYLNVIGLRPADMDRYCSALSGELKLFKNFQRDFFRAVKK